MSVDQSTEIARMEKMLAALKAFSMWKVAPLIGEYLDGVCTSGLWEAELAAEHSDEVWVAK